MKKISLIMAFVACMCCTQNANAQFSDIFNKVTNAISSVTGKSTTTDITGTWTLKGSAVQFESDNLLMSAGGAAAASALEGKIDEQLAKIGINAGKLSFTFNSDKTFSINSSKLLKGTYTFDAENNTLVLSFGNSSLAKINAKTIASTQSIKLLFKADKLLSLVSSLASSLNNSTLSTIGDLAKSYDGMMVGFTLTK